MVTSLPESPPSLQIPQNWLSIQPIACRSGWCHIHSPRPKSSWHEAHTPCYYPLLLAKLKAETGFNLTHYKQVVEGGGDVGFKPLSNLSTPFNLWVVTEVLQVNTASKTWNLLEPRAWKVVLPNHMLLKRKFCYDPRVRHKQG